MTMEEDQTKFTKLFVGGIPYHSADETLKEYFEQFDDIVEAVIIRERSSQRSKGYGFVTMATKEGAERACVNKRPIIDGRRANVDLAYLGAKPKTTTEGAATEGATTPECPSAPSSPTGRQADADLTNFETKQKSEQDNTATAECSNASTLTAPFEMVSATDNGSTQSASEEHISNYSTVQNKQKYESGRPAQLKPRRVSGMQAVTPNPLPLLNTMIYYQGNIPPYSPPSRVAPVDPNFLDQTTRVNFVTFMPAQGPVTPPIQNTSMSMQCLPHFRQVSPQPASTELIPSPRFIYTVPVWYVEQGGVSCGPVSLEPLSSYSQAPLISAEIDGNSNGGFSACNVYPIASYY